MKLSHLKITIFLSAICRCLPRSANAQSSSSDSRFPIENSPTNSTKTITLPPTIQTIHLEATHPKETTFSSVLSIKHDCNLENESTCKFSYIIPPENTQECNIYGPLCQTGKITVGVDLISQTTTATLPCSLYLTAQSKYLNINNPQPCAIRPYYPEVWKQGFGRSPECATYANLWAREGQYTLSNCGGNETVAKFSAGVCAPEQIPPGVRNKLQAFYYDCCGNCTVDIPEVRLYYFQEEDSNTACQGNTTIGTYNNVTSSEHHSRIRREPPIAVRTAILGTYTFTSPSIYLEIVGTASVSDVCGPVGPALTNPIVALPPGVLSTYSPLFPVTFGEKYSDPNGQFLGWPFIGYQKPLNIKDLACPTFGLGRFTGTDYSVTTTYGPPYLPIIIPPLQIMNLDPSWQKTCGSILHNAPGLKSFGIIDPPRILTPADAIGPPAPATVPALQSANPLSKAENIAQPAPTTAPGIPVATPVPKIPDTQNFSPSDPPSNPKSDPQIGANPISSLDPKFPESSGLQISEIPQPGVANSGRPEQNQQAPLTGLEQGSDPKTKQLGLGAIILSAFSGVNLQPSKIAIPLEVGKKNNQDNSLSNSASPEFMTIAGQTLIAEPSKIVVAVITLLPGAPRVSNSGTPVSLTPSGTLFINNSPTPIAETAPRTRNPILTVAGQVFTANPTGFVVAGSYITPGGPAQHISGTPISFDSSGVIYIGDSTTILPAMQTEPAFAVILAVGGRLFTASPSGFNLGKSIIVPGRPAVTISGTSISLDPSGVMVIGDSTVSLQQAQTPVPKVFTVADVIFAANPTGFNIGNSRIGPSSPAITISDTPIFLGPSGILVIGTLTTSLSATRTQLSPSVKLYTVGGQTFSADPIGFNVDGSRVIPGGTPVILSGTTVSLSLSGVLIIGDSTISLPTQTVAPGVYAIAGLAITAQASGAVVIDETTIVPGGLGATISGTPISLAPSGGVLAIGSSTYTLPIPTTQVDGVVLITAAELLFTRIPSGAVIFNRTSIFPGGSAIIISGTHVSLNTQGSLIVGPSVVPLSTGSPGSAQVVTMPPQEYLSGAWSSFEGSVMPWLSCILLGTIALKWLVI